MGAYFGAQTMAFGEAGVGLSDDALIAFGLGAFVPQALLALQDPLSGQRSSRYRQLLASGGCAVATDLFVLDDIAPIVLVLITHAQIIDCMMLVAWANVARPVQYICTGRDVGDAQAHAVTLDTASGICHRIGLWRGASVC
jgi:hypothetical protein